MMNFKNWAIAEEWISCETCKYKNDAISDEPCRSCGMSIEQKAGEHA